MNNKGESTRGISDQVSPIIFRSYAAEFHIREGRLHDVRLWKIFNDSISVPSRHPGFIVCHVQPPPPSILRFSQGFTVMPRNKTRPPLIRITPENPRNCTVARYYRARKNGIRVRFRHRGTASPFHRFHPIHPPRIFDPSIPPSAFPRYRYSRSVNQSSKPERFRNCISFVSP